MRLYNPERNDPLAASARLSADLNDDDSFAPCGAWLNLIVHRPLTYLKVRAEVFRWIFATPTSSGLPYLVAFSGPEAQDQRLGIAQTRRRSRRSPQRLHRYLHPDPNPEPRLLRAARVRRACPVAAPPPPARHRHRGTRSRGPPLPASFFAIGIACDYRYLYAQDIAALVGVFLCALDLDGLRFMKFGAQRAQRRRDIASVFPCGLQEISARRTRPESCNSGKLTCRAKTADPSAFSAPLRAKRIVGRRSGFFVLLAECDRAHWDVREIHDQTRRHRRPWRDHRRAEYHRDHAHHRRAELARDLQMLDRQRRHAVTISALVSAIMPPEISGSRK